MSKMGLQLGAAAQVSLNKLNCSLVLSIFVLVIASLFFFVDLIEPVYSGFLGLFLCAAMIVSIPWFDWAPIYAIRFLLLAVPGTIFATLVLFNAEPVIFASYGIQFQIPDVASSVTLITSAALAASAIGWVTALRCAPLIQLSFESGNFNCRFVMYGLVALVAGTFAGASLPDFVWIAPYSRGMSPYLNIGIFSVFAIFGVLGMFVVLLLRPHPRFWHFTTFTFVTIYVLLFCLLLRGTRLDAMGAALGLIFVYVMAKSKKINIILIISVLIFLALLSQVWGSYRAYAHCANMPQIVASAFFIPNAAVDSCSSAPSDSGKEAGSVTSPVITYRSNTMGDVVSTLYQVVGMTKDGTLEYRYGETYLNYLKSTLPRFIDPGRPDGFKFPVDTRETTGGSLYELAEAYVNFGFLGCILIPAFLAFLFGQIHRGVMEQKSLYPLLAYAIVLALLIRGTWYQNFSFYKAGVAWVLLELIIWFVATFYWRWRQRPA